jgi:hypothetical protein
VYFWRKHGCERTRSISMAGSGNASGPFTKEPALKVRGSLPPESMWQANQFWHRLCQNCRRRQSSHRPCENFPGGSASACLPQVGDARLSDQCFPAGAFWRREKEQGRCFPLYP